MNHFFDLKIIPCFLGIVLLNITGIFITSVKAETPSLEINQTETIPNPNSLDLNPQIIEESPVLQHWLKETPNVLQEINNDPSFKTVFSVGYSQFPSFNNVGGIKVGIDNIFLGKTGLTVSGGYQTSFDGIRQSGGADLQYYLLPLGNYINIAPLVGYQAVGTKNFSTNGVNIGARLMLSLSRTGAANISLSQSFVSPGSNDEVGITTLSVGYAIAPHFRLSADIQKQNSRAAKDSQVGINFEWMP